MKRIVGTILVGLCSLTSSCSWLGLFTKGAEFKYQDEVGIAKISVISVAPWEEIEKVVIPTFKLDASEALQKVGASVRVVDEAYLRSLSAALQVTVPGAAAPKTGADSKPEAPKPGQASTDSAKADATKTPVQTSGTPQATTDPSQLMSALGQHRLASALFQEVQLLNSYIKHVMKEENSEAYLLSMDVALLPARKAEVDALVLVAFVGAPDTACVPAPGKPCHWTPTVMPVILSEDIEISRHTRQIQNVAQLALSIAAAFQGAGGTAGLEQKSQELLKATGRDINALQVVGSATPNSFVVRFGAGYGVETNYALFPQVRRVHGLLFVPKGQDPKRSIFAVTHTIFQYADGKEIPFRSEADRLRLNSQDFLTHTGLNVSENEVEKLWGYFHMGRMEKFEEFWKGKTDCPQGKELGNCLHVVPVALSEMARLSLKSRWSYSEIHLPKKRSERTDHIDLPGSGTQRVAFDNGQVFQVRLSGQWLSTELNRWKLTLLQDGHLVNLFPNSVTQISDRLVELGFPSLRPFNPAGTVLVSYQLNNNNVVPVPLNYKLLTDTPPARSPIRLLSSEIAADADGVGEAVVEVVSADVKSFILENTPAVFMDASGKTTAVLPFVGGARSYSVLSFRHLVPGRSVTIVARGGDGKEMGKVSLPVIEGGGKKEKK